MELTYCQTWTLESLCALAATTPITAAKLAAVMKHSVPYTETYLRQLEGMGLVRTHHVSGAEAWRPSSDGLLLGVAL